MNKKNDKSALRIIATLILALILLPVLAGCEPGAAETTENGNTNVSTFDTTDDIGNETTASPGTVPDTAESTTSSAESTGEAVTTAEPDTAAEPDTTAEPVTTVGQTTETEPVTTVINNDYEIAGDDFVILGTRAMEVYYGSTKYGTKYAGYVSLYADMLENTATVYSMVIPDSAGYYIGESKRYGKTITRTTDNIDNIEACLSRKVVFVDVYDALLPHVNEDIYFRTDHHWTGLGAYYGAEEFAKAAGVPFDDISTYAYSSRPGYVGSMYRMTKNNSRMLENPESFDVYRPDISKYTAARYSDSFENPIEHDIFYSISDSSKFSWYETFLGGDEGVTLIKTTAGTGRKLIIIKDSFGNALAPYFMSSFDEIYFVDFRSFELNVISFIKERGITDCLIALNAFNCSNTAAGRLVLLSTQ